MDELLLSLRRGFNGPIELDADNELLEDIPLNSPPLNPPPSNPPPLNPPNSLNIRDILHQGPLTNLSPMENLDVAKLKLDLTEQQMNELIMDDMVFGSNHRYSKPETCIGDLVCGLTPEELQTLLSDANDHHTGQRRTLSTPSMFNAPTTNHFKADDRAHTIWPNETPSAWPNKPTAHSITPISQKLTTPTPYSQSYYGQKSQSIVAVAKPKTFQQLKQKIEICTIPEFKNFLLTAARKGVIRDIELLVNYAKINSMNDFLNDALVEAIKNDHCTVAKYLVKYGADVKYQDNLPLTLAVTSGNSQIARHLIQSGADVNIGNGKLLYECCSSGDYIDVLKVLIDNGINVYSYYQKALLACSDRPLCHVYLVQYNVNNVQEVKEAPIETYGEFYDDDDYDGIILRPDEYFNSDSPGDV